MEVSVCHCLWQKKRSIALVSVDHVRLSQVLVAGAERTGVIR